MEWFGVDTTILEQLTLQAERIEKKEDVFSLKDFCSFCFSPNENLIYVFLFDPEISKLFWWGPVSEILNEECPYINNSVKKIMAAKIGGNESNPYITLIIEK